MTVAYNSISKKEIANITKDIRDVFGVQIPIEKIDSVINRMGGKIIEDPELVFGNAYGYVKRQGDGFVIALRPHQSETRRNFTIAHELGHLFIHMGYKISDTLWKEQSEKTYYRDGNSSNEYEANEFAAAFLMPEDEYKEIMDRYTEGNVVLTSCVADYFNVSVEAASNRGKWLGLLQW